MNSITMKLAGRRTDPSGTARRYYKRRCVYQCGNANGATGNRRSDCKRRWHYGRSVVYARVFTLLDPATVVTFQVKDGDRVKPGDLIGTVTGDIRVLLSGERVALNYLQRMSGIATYTRQVADLLEGSGVTLLDTRKTTPNCRIFEKYAVRVGGGCNHRYNLSDGVLLKDNHIGAAGSITNAIQMAKAYAAVCP